MIIVHSELPVKPESRDEVDARGAEFAAKCRTEDNCTDYQLAWKFGEPNILRLVENWASYDAYKIHTEQPHVKEWAAWIPAHADGPLNGTRYHVTEFEIV